VSAPQSEHNGQGPSALTPSVAAVNPQVRSPGNVPGPRANRTIAAILDATRQIFLVRGYAGTTIDDITRVAGVSRASFYTYFASKRVALMALGAHSLTQAMEMTQSLAEISPDWDVEDLTHRVEQYFNLLEEHGSFVFAWTQAAQEDEEFRRAGERGHLELCRRLGMALASLGGRPAEVPVETGLLVVAMLERVWAYSKLYAETLDKEALQRATVRMLAAAAQEGF
jgi:AcrR family transcriptional regulator